MKEGEGCVEVCLELLAGQLKPPDSVSFILNTTAQTALGKKNFKNTLISLFPVISISWWFVAWSTYH